MWVSLHFLPVVEYCKFVMAADIVSLEVDIDSLVVASWFPGSKEASLGMDLLVVYCRTCRFLNFGDFIFYKL